MAKVKKVGFNFFRPIVKVDGKDVYFDLKNLFEQIRLDYARSRVSNQQENYKLVYSYNGEPARLADISIDVESQYYHLVFERLNYQVPSRTTLYGDSEAIELDDDEYIGIDVSVLYDPVNHIMMIQRNRDSLGPTAIKQFLATLIEPHAGDNVVDFDLAIVLDKTVKRSALKQAAYRKLHYKVIGTKADGIIEKFIKEKRDIGVDSVEIIFNAKPGKNGKIDDDYVITVLEEYIDDPEVQKLRIRSKKEDDSKIELIDLVDQKLEAFCEFEFVKNRHLNPISVFDSMLSKYNEEGFKNKVLKVSGEVESVV